MHARYHSDFDGRVDNFVLVNLEWLLLDLRSGYLAKVAVVARTVQCLLAACTRLALA